MMPVSALRAIFTVNLGVKKSERVLVFTDKPTRRETLAPKEAARRGRLREIANLTADIGRGIAREITYVEYPAGGSHGKEPPARLWQAAFGRKAVEALKGEGLLEPILRKRAGAEKIEEAGKVVLRNRRQAVDAVVALSNFSTSHTTFRDFLTGLLKARFASMPLFDFPMLQGPMNVDWKALAKRTREVARVANRAVDVEITTPNGTRIAFSARGRKAHADTGLLTRPGSFGNLPAGEAFLAPVEGTARGTLVLEWAPTRKLRSPVMLTVEDGRVTGVSGEDELRPDNANIAELGIGTNDRAIRPDNILESEKILGTVHIALGDNSTFGGKVKTPFHQDFVFFKPTVVITDRARDRSALLEDGRLKV
jgi:leucyl aminopeptidase (aminopeptidase T)